MVFQNKVSEYVFSIIYMIELEKLHSTNVDLVFEHYYPAIYAVKEFESCSIIFKLRCTIFCEWNSDMINYLMYIEQIHFQIALQF